MVLDKAHNPAMTQLLDALNPEIARTVIDAGQDGPSIVLAIKQATDEGALVALLVDRARPGEPWLPAPLLGADAPFPTAPWLIAAALKVPVVLAFGLYRGGNRYDLAFEVFSPGLTIERHNRSERAGRTGRRRTRGGSNTTFAARRTTGSTSTTSGMPMTRTENHLRGADGLPARRRPALRRSA